MDVEDHLTLKVKDRGLILKVQAFEHFFFSINSHWNLFVRTWDVPDCGTKGSLMKNKDPFILECKNKPGKSKLTYVRLDYTNRATNFDGSRSISGKVMFVNYFIANLNKIPK